MLASIGTTIGLMLVYLVGALIVTALQEAVAGFLGKRARTPMDGLRNLIRGPGLRGQVLSRTRWSTRFP